VDFQPVDVYLARAFKMARPEGALIAHVKPEGAADRGGLRTGDVILEFNGRHIANSNDLPWFASLTPAGEKVSLTVLRDGAEKKLQVVMAPDPDEKPAKAREKSTRGVTARGEPVGITVIDLTPQLAAERGITGGRGVLVTELVEGSPAIEAGIDRDDVIVRIGRTEIENAADYRKALAAIPAGGMVLMLVRRSEHPFWVAFPKR
jgi:serine protease Do